MHSCPGRTNWKQIISENWWLEFRGPKILKIPLKWSHLMSGLKTFPYARRLARMYKLELVNFVTTFVIESKTVGHICIYILNYYIQYMSVMLCRAFWWTGVVTWLPGQRLTVTSPTVKMRCSILSLESWVLSVRSGATETDSRSILSRETDTYTTETFTEFV